LVVFGTVFLKVVLEGGFGWERAVSQRFAEGVSQTGASTAVVN